jgi:hypothetical protein
MLAIWLLKTQKVRRERTVWEALDHPNILPFYGHADDEEFEPFGAFISPVNMDEGSGQIGAEYWFSGVPTAMWVDSLNSMERKWGQPSDLTWYVNYGRVKCF